MALQTQTDKTKLKLHTLGFGDAMTERIYIFFNGDASLIEATISKNPYELMEVPGISFARADSVAKLCGVTSDEDPRRQDALTLWLLQEAQNSGHAYLTRDRLTKVLKQNKIYLISKILDRLSSSAKIIVENSTDIYPAKLWAAEVFLANNIKERSKQPQIGLPAGKPHIAKIDPDPYQLRFLNDFELSNLTVLTGGPGVGKTTITQILCDLLSLNKITFALCAPTGKAARRISEVTERPASTIHRLLGGNPAIDQWKYNPLNKLRSYRFVIVDESSMLDLMLAFRLMSALPEEARLIFIGDIDQLPPVGPGTFFRDLIKSGLLPVHRLLKNHRQGKGSMIAENALRINRGELKLIFDDDFIWSEADNPILIRERILPLIKMLRSEYPDSFLEDVQVLTPQKGTMVGTEALNSYLREEFNPRARGSSGFCIGDKVMQTYNDYDLGIFNGFVGQITKDNVLQREFMVNFWGEKTETRYPKKKAESGGLIHAYAATIHKFQGSETKAGIVIVSSTHTWMLNRNLIYTAMTRFKEKCILLGDRMGLKRAVTNTREEKRLCKLLDRIVAS